LSLAKALYIKNVPDWERMLRLVAAAATVAVALALLQSPWSWLAAASAAGFGLTGLVGFCPMCAMVGRRLTPSRPPS
jgi:Protein of unknown function (DUF2892)